MNHRAASGSMRSEVDIHREIQERQTTNQRLMKEMSVLSTDDDHWKAKKTCIDMNVQVVAVLRWVLGEDLLWE